MGPGWEEDVGWAALSVRGVLGPWRQEQVRLLELRVTAGGLREIESFVACSIVTAGPVASCTAHSGVMAPRVENLIAQGAPVVLLAFEHAQAVANLSDELLGRDGKAERFARYDLPELLSANLALRGQGGPIDQTRLLAALVMPCRIYCI